MEGSGRIPKNQFSVMIATPYYEVKAFSPQIPCISMVKNVLNEIGITWDYKQMAGDAYVTRVKNALVHLFLQSDFTHLLMIDSDLAWDLEGFCRLLKAAMSGAEIVGGAFPNKNNWECYGVNPLYQDGKPIIVETNSLKLVECWGIPGGFIFYSKKAFERVRGHLNNYRNPDAAGFVTEYFKIAIRDNPCRPEESNTSKWAHDCLDAALADLGKYRGPGIEDKVLECFRANIERNGDWIGEDYYFQRRFRESGGRIFCEPNINFQHWGVKAWEGNYWKSLQKLENQPVRPSTLADPDLVVKDYREDWTTPPLDFEKAAVILREGYDRLSGATKWLSAGTALGLYRQNDFIPGDTDIDVAVLGYAGIEGIIKAVLGDYELIREVYWRGMPQQIAFRKNGIIFDIFIHWQEGTDYVNHSAMGITRMPKDYYDHAQGIGTRYGSFNFPHPVELYLEKRYGPDWRTPKDEKPRFE